MVQTRQREPLRAINDRPYGITGNVSKEYVGALIKRPPPKHTRSKTMTHLRLPRFTGSEAQQLQQLKSYLTYLVQELNFALSTLEKEELHGKN